MDNVEKYESRHCLVGPRETLLPKLLSGEIEIPKAKAFAEEVTP